MFENYQRGDEAFSSPTTKLIRFWARRVANSFVVVKLISLRMHTFLINQWITNAKSSREDLLDSFESCASNVFVSQLTREDDFVGYFGVFNKRFKSDEGSDLRSPCRPFIEFDAVFFGVFPIDCLLIESLEGNR